MKNLNILVNLTVALFLFLPTFSQAQSSLSSAPNSQAVQAKQQVSVLNELNSLLKKSGLAPLNKDEIRNILFDLKEVIKDPIGFLDYLIHMREYNDQICQALANGCDPGPVSQF